MLNANRTDERAKGIAQIYLNDDDGDLPTDEIIYRLETIAYRLAEEGKSSKAIAIFIAVAELEALKTATTKT